jgi:hypothetical protein
MLHGARDGLSLDGADHLSPTPASMIYGVSSRQDATTSEFVVFATEESIVLATLR